VRARAAEGATDSVAAAGAVKAQRRHAGAWEGGAGAGGRGSVSGGGRNRGSGCGGGLRETLVGAARAPRGEAREANALQMALVKLLTGLMLRFEP
jgi:hypothetical protein